MPSSHPITAEGGDNNYYGPIAREADTLVQDSLGFGSNLLKTIKNKKSTWEKFPGLIVKERSNRAISGFHLLDETQYQKIEDFLKDNYNRRRWLYNMVF